MNTLIVYNSQYGNTERIARIIGDTLRAFGQVQTIRVDQAHQISLEAVDLLIVGCPTQGFRPTPAVQSFFANISSQQSRALAVACFDTRFRGFLWKRSAAPRLNEQLRTLGIESLVPPESFFVKAMKKEGPLEPWETERAAKWALSIHQQYETHTAHRAVRSPG